MCLEEYDTEVHDLIVECCDPHWAEFQAEYLINCLCLKANQGKSIKEIFTTELQDMKDFEAKKEAQDTGEKL